MQITLVGLNARYSHSCLALFYVRNELFRHASEYQITLRQFTINESYYEILLQLSEEPADYYFFSAAIWNSDLICHIIQDLLSLLPESICIVGGPQAEVVMTKNGQQRLAAVLGEIERVEPRFYKDLQNRKMQRRYPCQNKAKGFSFPYLPEDFAGHLQNRNIYYESSRGCPFACTYCLSSAKKGVFHKNFEEVKKELGEILKWNPPVLRFVDRTFNDDMGRALAIWRFLAAQKCDTVFHFEMSPDRFTEEMFAFLEELSAGRFQFEFGVQSTNPETLAAINRPVNLEQAAIAIRRLSRLNTIHLHADLILGLPYETESSFLESFRDVFAMNPHYIQMGLLKILPDTPICQSLERFGYRYSRNIPYSVLANRWMDHATMRHLYWFCECVERFVNTRYFVSFWDYLRKKDGDIVSFFLGLQKVCEGHDFFQRAPTQEFLCNLLLEFTDQRPDRHYILEILRYDWLRCGHRYLPRTMAVREEHSCKTIRKMLFHHLKEKTLTDNTLDEGIFFLKKGFLLEFSSTFLEEQGFVVAEGRHFLSFLPQREERIYRLCRTTLFSVPAEQ